MKSTLPPKFLEIQNFASQVLVKISKTQIWLIQSTFHENLNDIDFVSIKIIVTLTNIIIIKYTFVFKGPESEFLSQIFVIFIKIYLSILS